MTVLEAEAGHGPGAFTEDAKAVVASREWRRGVVASGVKWLTNLSFRLP